MKYTIQKIDDKYAVFQGDEIMSELFVAEKSAQEVKEELENKAEVIINSNV